MVRLRSTDPNLQSGPVTLNNTIYFLLDGEIEVSEEVARIFWGHPTWARIVDSVKTPQELVRSLIAKIDAAAVKPVAVVQVEPVAEIKPPAPSVRGIRRKSP